MARRRLGTSTLAILRALAEGHRYGFDISTGVKTSVVVRAASVPHAKRAAELRGVDVTTVEAM